MINRNLPRLLLQGIADETGQIYYYVICSIQWKRRANYRGFHCLEAYSIKY